MGTLSRVLELSSQNFDRTLRSTTRRVLVDFWAPWCKPCIRMNPVIDKLAEKYSSVVFAKVNIDQDGDIATRFHISSLPAYVLFKDAHPSASRIGSSSEAELESLIFEQN